LADQARNFCNKKNRDENCAPRKITSNARDFGMSYCDLYDIFCQYYGTFYDIFLDEMKVIVSFSAYFRTIDDYSCAIGAASSSPAIDDELDSGKISLDASLICSLSCLIFSQNSSEFLYVPNQEICSTCS
jgi:hypothetical protein